MIPEHYVDLGRRYLDYDERDNSTRTMRMMGAFTDRMTVSWEDALNSPCVVILGEPGSGKTTEVYARRREMVEAGRFAFARPLGDLARADSRQVEVPDLRRYQDWCGSSEPAVFLLDSLDEARLAGGALTAAVDRLLVLLGPHRERARLVISCRVADWRPGEDHAALEARFRPTLSARSEEACAVGVSEPERLRHEMEVTGAWAFMERPADVEWLVRSWNRRGRIGPLSQLMEDNVAARLSPRKPLPPGVVGLSTNDAARGARELALLATLSRQSRIHPLGTAPGADEVPEAVEALPWLEPAAVAQLLDRGLFVDDSPGIRRLHHRSTTEYLTGLALVRLLGDQPGGFALDDFLVREQYGTRVVAPSLRAAAAWAAGASPTLRQALLDADPLILIEAGDPGAIPAGERPGILRACVDALQRSPWRRWAAGPAELSRFACSDLDSVVGSLLPNSAGQARDLLLNLIRLGPLPGCASDALHVALDAGNDAGLAARAAAAAGDDAMRQELVRAVAGAERPQTGLLYDVADELYPSSMTAAQLGEGLIAWASAGRADRHALTRWSSLLAQHYSKEGHDTLIATLGPVLLRLVSAAARRDMQPGILPLAHLVENLMERRVAEGVSDFPTLQRWAPWIWALARAGESHDARQSLRRGAGELLATPAVRRAVVSWQVQERGAASATSPWEVFRGEPWALGPRHGDNPWLLEQLSASVGERRHAWLQLAYRAAASDAEVEAVHAAGAGYPDLAEEVKRRQTPTPVDTRQVEHEAEMARRQVQRDERHRENVRLLQTGLDELAAGTWYSALHYLSGRMNEAQLSRWGRTDWASLGPRYGDDVASAARQGFKQVWRSLRPQLPHEREEANSVEWLVPVGLTGLNIDFADGLPERSLTDDEVELATIYALCEINGFPEWFQRLALARPDLVRGVFGRVLFAEYEGTGSPGERGLLDRLAWRDCAIRPLADPLVRQALEHHVPRDETALERAIEALGERTPSVAAFLESMARQRSGLGTGWVGAVWWAQLARTDGPAAVRELATADGAGVDISELMAALTAADWSGSGLAVTDLVFLIRMAYRAAPPSGDVAHESGEVYSPGFRDDWQDQRERLIGRLGGIPGPEAHAALLELVADPQLAVHGIWFERLARRRAEEDAERPPWTLSEVRELIESGRRAPSDAAGLFRYAHRRVEDIRRTVEGGDFSPRAILRTAPDEAAVQHFLAYALHLATHGVTSVVREPEVYGGKKPDIRLYASGLPAFVSIEVKIAENWTVAELERGLAEQLVGQYLRDPCSRHGVYVLVCRAPRSWTLSGQSAGFVHVVAHLAAEAERLSRGGIELAVVGIDLSGPAESPRVRRTRRSKNNAPRNPK